MDNSIEARVARGMELVKDRLDEIDTDRLDIADPVNCVLGQLFGSFHSHEAVEFRRTKVERWHGYPVNVGLDGWGFADADLLTEEWKSQIEVARRPVQLELDLEMVGR